MTAIGQWIDNAAEALLFGVLSELNHAYRVPFGQAAPLTVSKTQWP